MIDLSRPAQARAQGGEGDDAGFSMVELLVAMGIFGLLSTLTFSMLSSTAKTVDDVRSISNLTEEARVATERLTRELRQSSLILDAHLPADPTDTTSVTSIKFWVDFNGNGVRDENAADPEVVKYEFDPASGQLTFTANDPLGTAVKRPILAANVKRFDLTFTSSLWEYDTDGNGVTDWTEIDHSAIGNGNGVFDGQEFSRIDSVGISIQLLDGTRAQTYMTQVDLRNQNKN